jgi:hypothetical protein
MFRAISKKKIRFRTYALVEHGAETRFEFYVFWFNASKIVAGIFVGFSEYGLIGLGGRNCCGFRAASQWCSVQPGNARARNKPRFSRTRLVLQSAAIVLS